MGSGVQPPSPAWALQNIGEVTRAKEEMKTGSEASWAFPSSFFGHFVDIKAKTHV